jgi:hypothetical protein
LNEGSEHHGQQSPESPAVPAHAATFEQELAQAEHHRQAMVSRRNIGLRIGVGITGFDLVLLKLAIDASAHVEDHDALAWTVRGVVIAALAITAGMLIQLEIRNHRDRLLYIAAENRAEALRKKGSADDVVAPTESIPKAVRNAWATTWPLMGLTGLTIGIFALVSLLGPVTVHVKPPAGGGKPTVTVVKPPPKLVKPPAKLVKPPACPGRAQAVVRTGRLVHSDLALVSVIVRARLSPAARRAAIRRVRLDTARDRRRLASATHILARCRHR